jgi:lysophospholipase L1-like esterase
MALGVLAIVVLTYFTLNRPPPPGFAPPGAAEASAAGSARTSPPEPARILVVGDTLTVGTPVGGQGMTGWPQLVAADIANGGRPVGVQVAAADGSGYRVPGPNGETFPRLVGAAGTDFDLVVLFGSQNDTGTAADVQAGVTDAIAAVRKASPDAAVLVIGPAAQVVPPPANLLNDRDAIRAATAAAGVTFIDPLVGGWFTRSAKGLFGRDGIHPTDAGHRYLADQIRPLIDAALPPPS